MRITDWSSDVCSSDLELAWLGNILIFGAVLCEGAYAVIGKKLTAVLSPKRISAVINLWGFVLMTPMGLYTALHFDFTAVPVQMWALLLFYALAASVWRSEEHTSELQSLMRISYADFCLQKKTNKLVNQHTM